MNVGDLVCSRCWEPKHERVLGVIVEKVRNPLSGFVDFLIFWQDGFVFLEDPGTLEKVYEDWRLN